jgi:hypothetical protein
MPPAWDGQRGGYPKVPRTQRTATRAVVRRCSWRNRFPESPRLEAGWCASNTIPVELDGWNRRIMSFVVLGTPRHTPTQLRRGPRTNCPCRLVHATDDGALHRLRYSAPDPQPPDRQVSTADAAPRQTPVEPAGHPARRSRSAHPIRDRDCPRPPARAVSFVSPPISVVPAAPVHRQRVPKTRCLAGRRQESCRLPKQAPRGRSLDRFVPSRCSRSGPV